MRGFTLALAPALALCAGGLVAAPALAQEIGMSPLSALQQSLHLNAQQEAAWKVYRQQAGAPQQAQGRRQAAAKMLPKLTAPQRMDLIEAEMRQEMVDLQKQSQALKTFYATLSPEQQRTFDKQTLPPAQGQGQAPGQ